MPKIKGTGGGIAIQVDGDFSATRSTLYSRTHGSGASAAPARPQRHSRTAATIDLRVEIIFVAMVCPEWFYSACGMEWARE